MNTKHKGVLISTIAYIYIPILLFLFGYVVWYFALPTSLILGYFLCRMFFSYQKMRDDSQGTIISIPVLIIVLIILTAFTVSIGWGGWFPQSGDWYKHNAVLHDLCERRWPVYYTELETSMLTYYIGQYMVPAILGKITYSFQVAKTVMGIWGTFGLFLVYLNLVRVLKVKSAYKQIGVLVLLFFFSGMTVFTQMVLHNVYPDMTFSGDDRHWIIVRDILLQYRSNFVMLRWVMPQCVVPWLIMLLFMEYRRKCEYYALLFLPALLFASFSFITFCFYALLNIVYLATRQKKTNVIIRCFSLSNVLPILTLGSILFFYFLGYVTGSKPDYLSFQVQTYGFRYLFVYFAFCFFMFGIYALLVWKENKRNVFFYFTVYILMLIPLFKMGLCNDWVMSTSIPALFALMVYVMEFLQNREDNEWYGIKKGILIVCLLVGAWYPFCEWKEGITAKAVGNADNSDYGTLAYFSARWNQDLSDDLKYNYYTYNLEDNIFYHYLARERIDD